MAIREGAETTKSEGLRHRDQRKMHPYLGGRSRVKVGQKLRYVYAILLTVLALNALHLVL
jgi:hypothetical protein